MNIVLQTHDSEKHLAFIGIQRFSDQSGYCTELEVRSGSFAGQMQFCFEAESMARFVAELEQMNRALVGSAMLKPLYEDSHVTCQLNRAGRLDVFGEIVRYSEHPNRLQFGFQTDQTCLAPLIQDLRASMEARAV